jgi:hypothetical protein
MRPVPRGALRSVPTWWIFPSQVMEVDLPVPEGPDTISPRRPSCLPRLPMISFSPVVVIFRMSGVATRFSSLW